jgi:endonuclease YncB( thermonuclease family)
MSRRRRNVIFAGCLLLAAVLVLIDRSPTAKQTWRPQPSDFEKYHRRSFTVVRVVDGDTLDIDSADGEDEHTRIRLWGIDTPETKSSKYGVMYFGPEAAKYSGELALGKKVTVYLDEANKTRGKYGRLLAYVQLPDRRFLNEALVTEGYAYADLRFRHSLYNKYEQLESLARAQKKGLWQDVTRQQFPEWLQRKKPQLLRKR